MKHLNKLFIIGVILITFLIPLMAQSSSTDNLPYPEFPHRLTNKNATREALALYNYICETYGNNIISGQQESTWKGTPDYEMNYVKKVTGKLPAIRGLDFINQDFRGVTKRSIEWWKSGGIVSICWHWGTPPKGVGYESSQGEVDIDLMLDESTDLHKEFVKRMDEAGRQLKKLQDAGVPVLWRPFHEFDGAWFWWGKGGPERFIELWRFMYNHFTNDLKLNNLIWVLGYSHKVESGWFPGEEYVDISGADNYATGSQIDRYNYVYGQMPNEDIPLAYHECGPLPDPEELIEDYAQWVWFLTWHTIHIMEQNTPEYVNYVYNHDYVITKDELPDFSTYVPKKSK